MRVFHPNGCEWTPNFIGEKMPDGLIALPEDHQHCKPTFDRATHYIDYNQEGWPVVAYTPEELAEMQE